MVSLVTFSHDISSWVYRLHRGLKYTHRISVIPGGCAQYHSSSLMLLHPLASMIKKELSTHRKQDFQSPVCSESTRQLLTLVVNIQVSLHLFKVCGQEKKRMYLISVSSFLTLRWQLHKPRCFTEKLRHQGSHTQKCNQV